VKFVKQNLKKYNSEKVIKMQGIKQITITWDKELKKSVSFIIEANGNEVGIIKREEMVSFAVAAGNVQLVFRPKAPKWFGWKALMVEAICDETPTAFINIGVEDSKTTIGKLVEASTASNQLHTKLCQGFSDYRESLLKKW